ncbi:MAG: type IV pilus twitching motility protein PilT [Gammaproteobacteria bacterium]|nr:type IV pilus twitching motility protein PilT [Gammaproteobacteria bacterium]
MDITELLQVTIDRKASDLHLAVGEPPIIRVDGELIRLDKPVLTNEDLHVAAKATMSEDKYNSLAEDLEVDFSTELEGQARYRVNFYHQINGLSAAFRLIPNKIPSLSELHMPDTLKKLCDFRNGIVLVTGPTGSGKSTTLSALINYLNTEKDAHEHIITIEDPIEFVYKDQNCLIDQREVGKHTHGFNQALRAALREDPDILLVGEMRDLETIRLALTAAETGHLVFATMHTNSAAKTINRIIDVFQGSEAEVIRTMLAESLRAIVAQTLLKRPEGGRIAALELMVATPAIRNLIREQKVAQIYSAIQTGKQHGMCTMDQDIEEKVNAKLAIAPKEVI